MQRFDGWRKALSYECLHSKVWVELLRTAALQQAEVEEAEAGRAAFARWLSWISEGPAGGLRRQHRFTRLAMGWTETKVASTEDETIGEHDDLDGLSAEQVEDIRKAGQRGLGPAMAQQEVNDAARAWGLQWGPLLGPQLSGHRHGHRIRDLESYSLTIEGLIVSHHGFGSWFGGLNWDR